MGFFDIESGPAAKFDRPGDSVTGVLTRPYSLRPATEFGSNKPKVDDRGEPVQMAVIELQTQQRDPSKPGDDGLRVIYAEKFGQRKAIGDAMHAAGATDLEVGGTLTVQYVRDDPSDKGNPLKVWSAHYVSPNGAAKTFPGSNPIPEQRTPQFTGGGVVPGPNYSPAPNALVEGARGVQAHAAAQQVATAPAPAANGALDTLDAIKKVKELSGLGFTIPQIAAALPALTIDQVTALAQV